MMILFLQVIWRIWILAAHHVWPPHRMLCHFLYRPPCPREKSSNSWPGPACTCLFQVMKLVRMRQQGLDDDDFEGKTYSRVRYQRIREGNQILFLFKTGKCNVEHERVGTAEYDLPPCEARGWVWGSQASLDKLLGSGYVQSCYVWRWRGVWATYISDQPVRWGENIKRFINETKPTAESNLLPCEAREWIGGSQAPIRGQTIRWSCIVEDGGSF